MRDFFINGFEKLVGVIVIFMAIGVLIAAFGAMANPNGGVLIGLGVLIGGAVYVLFMGGAMYLGLGIYQNTKRTADALERKSF